MIAHIDIQKSANGREQAQDVKEYLIAIIFMLLLSVVIKSWRTRKLKMKCNASVAKVCGKANHLELNIEYWIIRHSSV